MGAFWPGYRWRILAHHTRKRGGKDPGYTGEQIAIRSDRSSDLVEFDELCIDHWFHLEQMDSRYWWIGIGDPSNGDYYHVNVHIDGKKKVTVSVEDQT